MLQTFIQSKCNTPYHTSVPRVSNWYAASCQPPRYTATSWES